MSQYDKVKTTEGDVEDIYDDGVSVSSGSDVSLPGSDLDIDGAPMKPMEISTGSRDLGSVANESSYKFKACIITALVLNSSACTLFTRWSRSVKQEKYNVRSVVFMQEIFKAVTCLALILSGKSSLAGRGLGVWGTVRTLWAQSTLTSVPALLYFVQNVIQYFGIQNLPAAVFSVLIQCKILTAAIFSILLLGRSFTKRKWRALLLLVIGSVLVDYHAIEIDVKPAYSKIDKHNRSVYENPFMGFICVAVQVSLSGCAGVYFEKVLKNQGQRAEEKMGIWDRNFQLASWSIVFGAISLVPDRNDIMEFGLFHKWTPAACVLCGLMVVGGLLVGAAMKYTNTVIKSITTTASLVLIETMAWLLLGDPLDMIFAMGSCVVVMAVVNYADDGNDPGFSRTKRR